jgi:two-component system, cell cycle sensor histidine kinase and response regulator CckA
MTPSSPDQLLAAHEDASVGMALVHANGSDVGRFVRVSGALVKMLGHPGQALLDTTLPAITHQDDVDLDSGKWRSLLAGEVSSYEVEKRLVRADGEIVWVQLHASLVHDPEGSPLYTVMRVVDITRLKRTASQLAAVIDSALVAIVTADAEGVILEYNPAAERLFGVSEARAVGSPLDLIVPEERREALMRMFRGEDAHLLGRRMEMNALDADGHEFPVELVIAQIQADPPVFTGFIRDLRETYAAQQALAQSERRFRRIMEATSDGIWAIDVEFRTTFMNRRAAAMIGYEPHELIGRPLLELLEAPSRAPVAEALERRGGNGAAACSATFTHRDQRPVKVLMSATPLLDEEGGHVGSLAMVTDITARLRAEHERAELEARLRQAQRLETVGQLAGLLSVIEGYASYVADEVTDRPGAVEGIEEIRRAADRGAKLTHRLLMCSRRDRANPETVDLRTVVDEARPLLEGTLAGQCELAVETPDQPVLVKIDVEQFEQLLLNLAANACDAMPDGGLLAIDLRRVDEGRVQMDVSDTGTGMSEEVAERAFEPFFTTKPAGDGSGLGLATVYGIVTQSGGEVRLTTTPGVGTRVAVELPAADVEAGKAETPGDRGPRAAHGETILLVEDEDAVRSMAARILRRHGYEVIETPGAEEALAAYRGLDCPPSLVLTDVAMPRMSGVELAARLGKGSPPVVFMSGYTDQSVDNPDALARSAGFLHKPFSAAALLHRVGEALSVRAD